MTSTPSGTPDEATADVEPGDVAEHPTKPDEDGVETSADPGENPDSRDDRTDSSTTAPLDADEGDPSLDSYPG